MTRRCSSLTRRSGDQRSQWGGQRLPDEAVERAARAHGGGGFGLVRLVVASGVDGVALDGDEFGDDGLLVGGEVGVFVLGGEGLGGGVTGYSLLGGGHGRLPAIMRRKRLQRFAGASM